MNIFLKKTEDRSKPNRRDFLLQSSCASLGITSIVNTIAQMKLVGAAAAQSAGDDYKALVCVFLNGGVTPITCSFLPAAAQGRVLTMPPDAAC